MTEDRQEDHAHDPWSKLAALERDIASLRASLRTAVGILLAMSAAMLAGGGWVVSTTIETQRQAAINEDRIERHDALGGHPAALESIAEVRADTRALTSSTDARLAAIEASVSEIRALVREMAAEDRRRR